MILASIVGDKVPEVLVLVMVLLLLKRWRCSSVSQDFLDGGLAPAFHSGGGGQVGQDT